MAGLNTCPICNGTPHIESYMVYPKYTASYPMYFAVCNHCGAKTNAVPLRMMAILKWNEMVKKCIKEKHTNGL